MAGREELPLEHEVLRDEGGEGVMGRDLQQVLAIPEGRLMQVTTSRVSDRVMGGWVGSGGRGCRPVLALEGLLGDSPPAKEGAILEDKPGA